jgi:hypothetical protein
LYWAFWFCLDARSEVTTCCWAAEEELDGWQGTHHHLAPAQYVVVYTGMADAEADATFAAGAVNTESDVEAMAGELTSKCPHGAVSWGCCVLACMVCAISSWLC